MQVFVGIFWRPCEDHFALCYRDSLIVGVGNVLTSIYAGFVIFPIIGYLAKELDMDVDKVVDQGEFSLNGFKLVFWLNYC